MISPRETTISTALGVPIGVLADLAVVLRPRLEDSTLDALGLEAVVDEVARVGQASGRLSVSNSFGLSP